MNPLVAAQVTISPDKQDITIDQLMSASSGLPNFHHLPGVDADPDLTWIDRETALKRIFSEPLLFKPGQGRAHVVDRGLRVHEAQAGHLLALP